MDSAPVIGAVILAAGEGKRFGGLKQLAELHGKPMLQHSIDAINSVAGIDPGAVVLGARADDVRAMIEPGRARIVICPGWEEGIAASLRTGVAALGDVDWALVLLGDQPLISAQAITAVKEQALAATPDVMIVRAFDGSRPAHPVAIRSALFDRVMRLRGDQAVRALHDEVTTVPVALPGSAVDIDTAADLERLADRRPEP